MYFHSINYSDIYASLIATIRFRELEESSSNRRQSDLKLATLSCSWSAFKSLRVQLAKTFLMPTSC